MWFIAGVLFLIVAVAGALGEETVIAAAGVAIAMAMFVLGLREPARAGHR
jgi:hypothetical protein